MTQPIGTQQGEQGMITEGLDETRSAVQVKTCDHCHTEDRKIDYITHEGKLLCVECFSDLVTVCSHCGSPFWRDNMTDVRGDFYCEPCFDGHFRRCSSCDEYVDADRSRYSEIHDRDYCETCFSERVTFCAACDGQIDPESCHANDRGECFCDGCWEHRNDSGENEYRELGGATFVRCISKRKYGIEIEAMLEADAEHLPSGQWGVWNQVTDGSLGDSGREYVSPILQGDEGFDEIEKFTATLKRWGYFVNQKCGLHIHVDGRDFDCAGVKTLLKLTRYFEPVLYAMLPSSRHEGTYSVPLERFPKSRFRIGAKDETALKRLWYGRSRDRVNLKSKYHHSRYYGLNIHSWFYRRSFEFRYHSGTLSPVKITNFIIICQAMVDAAKRMKQFRDSNSSDFQDRFEGFAPFLGLSSSLASYVRRRIMKFHPERFSEPVVTQA